MSAGLLVVRPGLATTVQDGGRRGHRAQGVPTGGAFDRSSLALANALVGNPADAAGLEMTLLGGAFEATAPMAVALAGAPMEATIVERGVARPVRVPGSFHLAQGARLELGGTTSGARTYLAVRGGLQTNLVLGSRSSEERLTVGTFLPAPCTDGFSVRFLHSSVYTIDLLFAIMSGLDAIDESFWDRADLRVSARSDRMGIRLEGPVPSVSFESERRSVPVGPGAIQVTESGLIVLGVAGGTMGGYPIVGHVIAAELDRVGQARPGQGLCFVLVDREKARRLDQTRREDQRRLLSRVAAAVGDAGALALCGPAPRE
jgi:antagonist of KipI